MQALLSVSLAHTASRIFSLFLSLTHYNANPCLRLFTDAGLYAGIAKGPFTYYVTRLGGEGVVEFVTVCYVGEGGV